ncbi:TetR/AcrR family transcriptional regulator [Pendulispora rubella]|uniref:TetR/AcrR family transcriptional regulator n=1 Tax=Pendulispora rubella TaxID=2741070 RepID=A0ABZ2L782_9BACT
MNAKEEQKERSHETILESASRLLREKGIAGARVAEVMKGAGLTVGGFYAHFDSKEALIEAALRRTAAGMRRRLFTKLEDKPPADRAEVVLKRYLSVAHRDAATEGCPFPAVVGEIATTAPEHGEILSQQVEALVGELEAHLPPAGPLSRRHLAIALVALMTGGLSLARALRSTELSDEVLRACRALGAFAARATAA